MRGGCNRYKIDELGRIVTGKTPPTQKIDNFGDKYPFITPRDMSGQKKIVRTERYLSEQGKDSVKNCLLPANSICVSCIGSDMGKVVMTSKSSVTNQQLNSVVCNDLFDPDFIYYSLVNISAELKNAGHHSTAVPILNKTDFSNFEIIAPGLPTQRRIAAILSSLDEKIELNRHTNRTLEAIAQALFKEWFVDFNFPGATGEMQESELGPIPVGWKAGKLGEIISFKNGKSSPERDDSYDYPVYGANGIIGCASNYNSTEQNIVIGRVGSFCGAVYLPLCKTWITDNAIIGEPNVEGTSIFCYILLKRLQLNNYKTGSGQPLVNQSILSNIDIVIPNNEVFLKYDSKMLSVYCQIVANELSNQYLSQIRDSLLPKLINGEIEA